ncbi:beta-glucuronosyltransferase GlcAT14B [Cucumis melo var. makuwa]|uniref:Beta-glucuronosyltransferase GlcAT14B n=1 Tax=Cucumis melo var. makuwa TaxID=1194695 RepID=A0A5A7SUA2_CUCMM|nr:beta-glucuronosyltransferase GlcAT14B [Cucumis melo var. makuwa]TYK21205.1 beta-glucuronosyltransferase GlcAT14B [Cucumis melo var. makuwa]
MGRRWIFSLAIGLMVSLFLLFLSMVAFPKGTPLFPFYKFVAVLSSLFVELKLHLVPISSLPPSPRFAYLISGSIKEGNMLKRTLEALYHPINRYVLHLDLESPLEEHGRVQEWKTNREWKSGR